MKQLRLFLAALLTVTTLSASKPSQAAVGAFVAAPLLIAGVVVAGGGVVTYAIGSKDCDDQYGLCKGLWQLFMAPVVLIGLVMLDGEQQVAFNELSSAQASKLGISEADLAIYNSEVDQVNMLAADVKSELSQLKKPTLKDSAAAWSNVKDLVSPETYAVMIKIAEQK